AMTTNSSTSVKPDRRQRRHRKREDRNMSESLLAAAQFSRFVVNYKLSIEQTGAVEQKAAKDGRNRVYPGRRYAWPGLTKVAPLGQALVRGTMRKRSSN